MLDNSVLTYFLILLEFFTIFIFRCLFIYSFNLFIHTGIKSTEFSLVIFKLFCKFILRFSLILFLNVCLILEIIQCFQMMLIIYLVIFFNSVFRCIFKSSFCSFDLRSFCSIALNSSLSFSSIVLFDWSFVLPL